MALAGNTVTLSATFVDADDNPASPQSDVTVRIYDANGRQVGDDATIPVGEAVSTGTYEHVYVVPNAKPKPSAAYFDFEFSALMPDGNPQVGRKREPIRWV